MKVSSNTGKVAAGAIVSEELVQDSEGKLFLLTDKAQVLRTRLGEIRRTGRVAQGVKIVDPGPGDAISGIRVLEDRRKAREEVDLQKLVKQEFPTN